jgi:hypothetical protein
VLTASGVAHRGAFTVQSKPKPGVLTAQKKQREAVKIASKGQCEVEVSPGECGWARCPMKGTQAAHIYPRAKCGKARDLPEVVVWTCNLHNCDHFDGRKLGIRVPIGAAQLAWQTIYDMAKDKPSSRALLGPKPEVGIAPYQTGDPFFDLQVRITREAQDESS